MEDKELLLSLRFHHPLSKALPSLSPPVLPALTAHHPSFQAGNVTSAFLAAGALGSGLQGQIVPWTMTHVVLNLYPADEKGKPCWRGLLSPSLAAAGACITAGRLLKQLSCIIPKAQEMEQTFSLHTASYKHWHSLGHAGGF